ncbi:hypothetical protein Tco_0868835 [Tanacetum coccineum]
MNATSSVKRPKSRDSHVKTSVLDVSKKEAVYVRQNKQTDNTFAKVVSNKENVVQIVLWVVTVVSSKHYDGCDHSLLRTSLKRFMGTCSLGNDNFAAITVLYLFHMVSEYEDIEYLQWNPRPSICAEFPSSYSSYDLTLKHSDGQRIFRYLRQSYNMDYGIRRILVKSSMSFGVSKKQDCTAMSTAEAEYVSLSACCAQVIWMRTQLLDYGF